MSDGPSSFDVSMRMSSGHQGASGGNFGMLKALIGTQYEEEIVHFLSETPIQITGFSNMETGLLPMLFKMRGDGFLAKLLDGFASADEAFGPGGGLEGGSGFPTDGGGDGGGGGGDGNFGSGSNRAFSSLPPMDMAGPVSDVPMHMLGRLSPSQSPGMGQGAGIDMGRE